MVGSIIPMIILIFAIFWAIVHKEREQNLQKSSLATSRTSRAGKPSPHKVKVRRIYKNGRVIVDVKRAVEIKANSLPYHISRNWKQNGRNHQGYYRCKLGAFKGEIEKRADGNYKFYIYNPPTRILNGSHGPCFTKNNSNRYHIHFKINNNDLDSGIMAVERLLSTN